MSTFAPALLPDDIKLSMCQDLLAEFGATSIRVRPGAGEIEFCCIMPWHDETGPSAGLNYQKLTYNCFSCGSHGGLLWMIATCRNQSTREVREWMETKTGGGADVDSGELLRLIDAIFASTPHRAAPIPRFSEKAMDAWAWIHPYMTEIRGIPEETLAAMKVGYAEKYPVRLGEVEVPSERIIIPHYWKGNLVGWQSRRLDDGDGTPKYLSTGDFPKDRTIYDYDPTRTWAVGVESPMSDLRWRHRWPFEGSFGAEVTDHQCRLWGEHPRFIYWPDNDEAGWKSVEGHSSLDGKTWFPGVPERVMRYSDVYVIDSPWAADPADMDEETVGDLIENHAVPYAVWRRPEVLRCWLCKDEHGGKCPAPADI